MNYQKSTTRITILQTRDHTFKSMIIHLLQSPWYHPISREVRLCPYNLVALRLEKRKATRLHKQQTRENTWKSIAWNPQSISPLRCRPSTVPCASRADFQMLRPGRGRPIRQLQFLVPGLRLIMARNQSNDCIDWLPLVLTQVTKLIYWGSIYDDCDGWWWL